jgi:uncharacterized membrane protein YidH (DUF202 family)
MPTDLEAVLALRRKVQAQKEKEKQANITMISVWFIISLVMLVLLFVDKSFAQATAELMYLF